MHNTVTAYVRFAVCRSFLFWSWIMTHWSHLPWFSTGLSFLSFVNQPAFTCFALLQHTCAYEVHIELKNHQPCDVLSLRAKQRGCAQEERKNNSLGGKSANWHTLHSNLEKEHSNLDRKTRSLTINMKKVHSREKKKKNRESFKGVLPHPVSYEDLMFSFWALTPFLLAVHLSCSTLHLQS